ncbi:MAG: 23S rRNA (adenine(2503)-C(2))-methyltransferase RlmN [Eggerthellaceae bacterium]|nr:23S rRNA (adenine(2503)-C(2))-methyltransferase RlmN [Eggerthellaceae bacterium]
MHSMFTGFETYSIDTLATLIQQWHQPRFRTKQLIEWVYQKHAQSFEDMTNLPLSLRSQLEQNAPLHRPACVKRQISHDGTRKYLLKLTDGECIETVGIPSLRLSEDGTSKRLTVCVSTQVGCPMACLFCATGQGGFTRNLYPGEIVNQVLHVEQDMDARVSNVVFMGQGEPFLNYDNVLGAARILNASYGCGVGARHITISTCGIPQGIKQFGAIPEQFTLAVSLHSAIQKTRNHIMPHCASMPLTKLKAALETYYEQAGRRITFEYMLIDRVNDQKNDLRALIDFCQGLPAHINILTMNDIPGNTLNGSHGDRAKSWVTQLEAAGIEATIRTSRGSDIAGACGQLKTQSGK